MMGINGRGEELAVNYATFLYTGKGSHSKQTHICKADKPSVELDCAGSPECWRLGMGSCFWKVTCKVFVDKRALARCSGDGEAGTVHAGGWQAQLFCQEVVMAGALYA